MDKDTLLQEIQYRTARSGGSGGQNVNKVETKVEARIDLTASYAFTDQEKNMLQAKLANQLNADGSLAASSQESRSQWINKQLATEKLVEKIEKALIPDKKRRATAIPARAVRARITQKRRNADKKANRKRLFDLNDED